MPSALSIEDFGLMPKANLTDLTGCSDLDRKADLVGTDAALSGVGCLLAVAEGGLLRTAGGLLLRTCFGFGEFGAAA